MQRPPRRPRLLVLAVLTLSGVAIHASAQDLPIAGPSDDAQNAIQSFRPAEGLKVELAAAEPDLANPVAFCFDEQGRLYVAETFRQDKGVLDNRGHMNWLEDDLSLQTVEQRGEMFRKYLGKEVDDWANYPDRIRQLEDRDGDGRYETATIFADGFNDILDGTGAGLLARQGNVYYTCIPNLWMLKDSNGDGKADSRTELAHGFGVRVAFRGHDMHGLIMGPDGRMYFSIGDRGYNVETREGKRLKRPDTGAVFRCDPDGSNLEVFAYGLRNPQELAFNDEGDLFTGDNNSDSGDRARWVYVAPHGDSGWRMYYQYLSDRGPWNRERIWHPFRDDEQTAAVQPAYIVPPIKNLADGPSGLAFDPGVGLPEHQRGRFFLVDFRGSAGGSGVRSFRVKPQGAGFEVVDDEWLMQSMLATDFDFGFDGALYVADWVDGWNGAGKGRIYRMRFDDQTKANPPSEVLFREGFIGRADSDLLGLLNHRDRRVRLEAQYELANQAVVAIDDRDDASLADRLFSIATENENELASRHAVWALGQIIRRTGQRVGTFESLARHESAELRRQAWRIAADFPKGIFNEAKGWSTDLLLNALKDEEPRVRFEAAIAAGRHGDETTIDPLLDVLTAAEDNDPFLRHAAITGLTGIGDVAGFVAREDSPSKSARLGLVVALRRLEAPGVAAFLNDADFEVAAEAARAIHDVGIEEAMPALAEQAAQTGFAARAGAARGKEFVRRVLNANYRLGGEDRAEAIAKAAADSDLPDDVRTEAALDLLEWAAPPRLDRVTNEFRPIEERPQSQAEAAVKRILPSLLAGPNSVREVGVKIASTYGITDVGPTLVALTKSSTATGDVRAEALRALTELKDKNLEPLVDELLNDSDPAVRAESRKSLVSISPPRAIDELAKVLSNTDATTAERQSAIATLAAMKRPDADHLIELRLQNWLDGKPPEADVQLDLLEAAGNRDDALLKDLAKRIDDSRPQNDPVARYSDALAGGSADRGREIFFGSAAASCRRCHKINGQGSDVGPDLSEIGKQKPREYLLQAIVDPNAKIAEGFETAVFAMDDGLVHSGIVKKEDDQSFHIMTAKGEMIVLEKEHIDDRAKGQSGMPADMTKLISRREIRDLVEFLTTLKERKIPEGHQ